MILLGKPTMAWVTGHLQSFVTRLVPRLNVQTIGFTPLREDREFRLSLVLIVS
jgi:hypothetical protein